MAVAYASIHFTVGIALRSKLLASSWVANQQHGRLVVAWIADRTRQAGFRADPASALPRCRDRIVAEDAAYRPTASRLFINADIDNDAVPETRGFSIQMQNGVNVVTETIIACATGAVPVIAPLTDSTSVEAQALNFSYYNAAGAAVTDLANPAVIRTIRTVGVTVQVRASAGAQGPTIQTWTTRIALRNP